MDLAALLEEQNPWWRDPALRAARDYPVRRAQQEVVKERVRRLDDRRAQVIVGPRQVGKSTLVRQVIDDLLDEGWPAPNLTYFDFSDYRLSDPVSPREVVEAHPAGLDRERPRAFFLDEISKALHWDRWLKHAVDSRIGRIAATDSAATLLREGTQESGQGRWDEYPIDTLSFREFVRFLGRRDESVAETLRRIPDAPGRYLALGGFPEHVGSNNDREVKERIRGDIVDRAIRRDLGSRHVDVDRVKDLFVYLIQDSGAVLNIKKRANDLQASRTTIAGWVQLLLDSALLFPLRHHTGQPSKRLRSPRKLYAADHGLIQAFALPGDQAIQPKIFEAAVFHELRGSVLRPGGEVTYFRTKDGLEADFVVELPAGGRAAIEVTAGERIRPRKVERLKEVGRAIRADRLIMIHGGVVPARIPGVHATTLAPFLLDAKNLLGGA